MPMSADRAGKTGALERATEEVAAGRLWRAKEILGGNISSQGYSPERFAAYGRVLARMQDTKEAGKYLFLSGLAEEGEVAVVETFLAAARHRQPSWIYAQFPGTARRVAFAGFPERVRTDLRQLGFPDDFAWEGPPGPHVPLSRWKELTFTAIVFSVLGLIVIGFLHGCYVVGGWVFQN